MKIGILTQPLRSNYGGILQNWALQQTLILLGHEPETIRYGEYTFRQKIEINGRWIAHQLLHTAGRKVVPKPTWSVSPNEYLIEFINKHIKYTRGNSTCDRRAWGSDDFDSYIVGSDQVWRSRYNRAPGQLAAMFGKYIPSGKKLFSYAASFGTDIWEFSEQETKELRTLISRFSGVSVRELSGVDLCKNNLGIGCEFVLDPTLLLCDEDYRTLIKDYEYNNIFNQDKLLGVYILDLNKEKKAIIDFLSERLGLTPYFMGSVINGRKLSIENWLSAFERCPYIVTDSFHGTAFSILFKKPFTTLVNPIRGTSRLTSILGLLDLEDRQSIDSFGSSINWDSIDERLNLNRQKSIDFIKKQLG